MQVTGGWSKRGFIAQIPEFNDCRDVPVTDSADVHTGVARPGDQCLGHDAHQGQQGRRHSTRSTTTSCTATCSSSGCRCSTTRSAAASRSSTRPTTTARTVVVADPVGPSLLPVVHARRPRQLLAVQRRAERRAALATRPRCRPRFSSPAPRGSRAAIWSICWSGSGAERGRLASARRLAAARRRRRALGGGRSARSAAGAGGDRPRAAGGRVPLRRRGARRAGLGLDRADLRDQRARHPPSARGARARRSAGRGCWCRAPRWSTRRPTRR